MEHGCGSQAKWNVKQKVIVVPLCCVACPLRFVTGDTIAS